MKSFREVTLVLMLVASAPALRAQNMCPIGLPPGTTCHSGQDENGAFFLMAVPANYAGQLVLWNHGYSLAPPKALGAADLGPALLLLPQGYAVAASSYRPDPVGLGGWAVMDAADDTENLRQHFVRLFGRPDFTYIVGASEGGIITAEIAELFGTSDDGSLNYDGALPLCGPLAGGRRNWDGGFDLRVVYQHYCQNLPRPSEPQYPLFLGLGPGQVMSEQELGARINECTGILLPPALRTAKQKQNLANILNVTRIPESFLLTDMGFATFGLQELTQVRTGGLSPITNLGVAYTGSTNDAELNSNVFRAGAHPDARAFLAAAYDPTGSVPMPVVTMHTIGDGLVIVENENAYRQTLELAGTGRHLFQSFTNANGHCQFDPPEFLASFQSLVDWVEGGDQPTQDRIADLCEEFQAVTGGSCRFNKTFQPAAFESRVPPRGN